MRVVILIDSVDEMEQLTTFLTKLKSEDKRLKGDFQKCLIEIQENGSKEIIVVDKKTPQEAPKKGRKRKIA